MSTVTAALDPSVREDADTSPAELGRSETSVARSRPTSRQFAGRSFLISSSGGRASLPSTKRHSFM